MRSMSREKARQVSRSERREKGMLNVGGEEGADRQRLALRKIVKLCVVDFFNTILGKRC